MTKKRIPETNQGITGEIDVKDFDDFQRGMRDRGLIITDSIIKNGITTGTALEIGPGPGYIGLEWLKKTIKTNLDCLEISKTMKKIIEKNSHEYGMAGRINIVLSDATKIFPFKDNFFDGVFTNGSLHEWSNPVEVFNEIGRVLKHNGRFFISDLKRNINFLLLQIMKMNIKKKTIKKGLLTSVNAAYLKNEIIEILYGSRLKNFEVAENAFGLMITGVKK